MDIKLGRLTNTEERINEIIILKSPGYYRWSTSGQVREKRFKNGQLSVQEKEDVIRGKVEEILQAINSYRGYCPKCGREIRLKYTDEMYLDKGESGRKVNREQIDDLIEKAERTHDFEVVTTPDSSRIGRRRSVSGTIRDRLKDLSIQVYSISQPMPLKCPECFDPYDDDSTVINETISDMQAELNLSKIKRNYKFGMPLRIKNGKPSGSLGYGLVKHYKIVGKDFRGNDILEEKYEWDSDKVQVANRIAHEYLSGFGTWKISQRLNSENIPSPQGSKWGRSAIMCILKNPIYIGWVRFGRTKSKNGKRIFQPADKWLIEKAKFGRVWKDSFFASIQNEIKRRATIGGRAFSSTALLIGLLKCMRCHYSMYQSKTKKKNGVTWKGYACGSFMHRGACYHNGKSQEVVDRLVLQEVLKLADDNTKRAFYERLNSYKNVQTAKELKEKKRALAEALKRLERSSEAYRRGVDTLEDYSKHKDEDEPIASYLSQEVVRLEGLKKDSPRLYWKRSYESAIRKFIEYPTIEDKLKVKTILGHLIDKIEIENVPHKHKGSKIKIYYKLD